MSGSRDEPPTVAGTPRPATASTRNGPVTDLRLVGALTIVSSIVLLFPWSPQFLVAVFGVPFLLFLPGYAIVSVLFPESKGDHPASRSRYSPGAIQRIALALLVSPVVVALVGVALSPFAAIQLRPVVVIIAAITLCGVVVAGVRRVQLPRDSRARPLAAFDWSTLVLGTRTQTVLLGVAVVILLGAVAFAAAVPPDGEGYSELYLLSEDEEGELVADGHPTEFTAGESEALVVGIENHEKQRTSYEVVMLVQEVDADGEIGDQERVDAFDVELEDGERALEEREVAPTMTGSSLRLQVLLYEDEAADDPTPENADLSVSMWISVDDNAADETPEVDS